MAGRRGILGRLRGRRGEPDEAPAPAGVSETFADDEPEPDVPEEHGPYREPDEGSGTDDWAIPEEPYGDEGSDERVRPDAHRAAQDAELGAIDEIAALERDLEESRTRFQRAEARADALTRELGVADARARDAAAAGVREEVDRLRAEARERIRAEVERIRAGTEARARSEAAERIRTRAEELDAEAERLIAQGREGSPPAGEGGAALEVAARTLAETLARLEDAERRATAADEARDRVEGENRDLSRRLERATEEAERAREEARRDPPAEAAPADRDPEAIEAQAADRIARIEADADERLRSEVGVARRAAEERFAEKLADRERALEREREIRVEAVEAAERRLSGIEKRLLEAVERLEAAERALAEEAERGPPDREDSKEERDDTAQWAAVPAAAQGDEPGAIAGDEARVSVTRAGPDELRSAGLSASQARRVIRYRDEHRLDSVAGLEEVPGFSRKLLDTLAGRLRD